MIVLQFNEAINRQDEDDLVTEWRVYLDTCENRETLGLPAKDCTGQMGIQKL
jgi:hypothetical protein